MKTCQCIESVLQQDTIECKRIAEGQCQCASISDSEAVQLRAKAKLVVWYSERTSEPLYDYLENCIS